MHPATRRFIEQFGAFFEREGVPRIAGQLTAFLLVSPDPQSLDAIAAGLGVSKASVSTDARRLEAKGLLQRVRFPGDRRDYYRIAPDGFRTMLRSRIDMLQRFDTLLEGGARLPGLATTARERMREWKDFHQAMIEALAALLSRWDDRVEGGLVAPSSRARR